MFYGEFEHTIDNKGRIIVPSKFRQITKESYIEKFFLTRGLDGCLFMFAEEEWKQQEQKFKNMPFTKAEARKFSRLYFSAAAQVSPDKQGRILIPQNLRNFAGLTKEVIIVGVSNRIEIWSKEKWLEFYAASRETFEETAEKLIE
jgi:MraZ protein